VAGGNGYGTFSIAADGTWTYTLDTAHNEFVGGTTYTDAITVATADGTTQLITVSILGTNDAAVLATGVALNYTENDVPKAIAPTVTVTDVDSADFNGGSLTVAFTANGTGADQLIILNQGAGAGQIGVSGNTVTYGGVAIGTFSGGSNGSNLVISFNGNAVPAAVQTLAAHILYANTSDNPATAARTVTFTLVDGDGVANGGSDTGMATAIINVTAVNLLPILDLVNGSDTGRSFTDNVTRDNTPTFDIQLPTGTVVGDIIKLYDGKGHVVGTTKVTGEDAGSGHVTLTTAVLEDGEYKVEARIVDQADNEGLSTTLWVTIDTAIPMQTAKICSICDDLSPTVGRIQDEGSTNDSSPFLKGMLSAPLNGGDTVAVFRNGAKVGEAAVSGASWTFQDQGLEDHQTYGYTVRVEDRAGNMGKESSVYTIDVDTTYRCQGGSGKRGFQQGSSQDDRLIGSVYGDAIHGGDGNDRIFGKSGSDRLYGDAGNDTLVGGPCGADTYVYTTSNLGKGDLEPGGHDLIIGTGRNWLDLTATVESVLTVSGTSLSAHSGNVILGQQLGPKDQVAFNDHQLMIDLNQDGVFHPDLDFQVTLVGVSRVTYDVAQDMLVLQP